MIEGKTGAEALMNDAGALPSQEMPTGDGTDTLEIERPPVRIAFPGDVASGRAASRRWSPPASERAVPAPRDSTAAPGLDFPHGLRLMQLPVRVRKSDR